MDDTSVAFISAVSAMWDICEEIAGHEGENTKRKITEKRCTNECNWNGKCVNRTCICNKGYGDEDCSIHYLDAVPELLDVGCGYLCDMQKSACDRVAIRSKKLVPDRVKCISVSNEKNWIVLLIRFFLQATSVQDLEKSSNF